MLALCHAALKGITPDWPGGGERAVDLTTWGQCQDAHTSFNFCFGECRSRTWTRTTIGCPAIGLMNTSASGLSVRFFSVMIAIVPCALVNSTGNSEANMDDPILFHYIVASPLSDFLVPSMVMGLLVIIPALRLLKRVGMSWAWALLSFIPVGLIVMVWVVAFASWKPADQRVAKVFN